MFVIVNIRATISRFSVASAATIVHRNHFFRFYQQNKSSTSKVKLDRLVILAGRFLNLPNSLILIKQKSLSLPRNLKFTTFGELLIVISAKVNLLYSLYLTELKFCLLLLIKQNCLQNLL